MFQHLPPFPVGSIDYAYQLHCHLGFPTRLGADVLRMPDICQALHDCLRDTCIRNQVHLLETAVEENWVRLLVSLRPVHSPARIVQSIKTNTSRGMFAAFPRLDREIGRRSLWSRNYYLRGIGDVTNETVLAYVARQRQHHESKCHPAPELAFFRHPEPQRFLDLRPFSHCVAEYNCHLVCCPARHAPVLHEGIAADLLAYIRRVTEAKGIELLSASVLEDHVHLFAALRPEQSPEYFALAVMNNTAHWMNQRNPGALKLWDAPGLWTPSAFLRTAGAVTTNAVRAHLRDRASGPL